MLLEPGDVTSTGQDKGDWSKKTVLRICEVEVVVTEMGPKSSLVRCFEDEDRVYSLLFEVEIYFWVIADDLREGFDNMELRNDYASIINWCASTHCRQKFEDLFFGHGSITNCGFRNLDGRICHIKVCFENVGLFTDESLLLCESQDLRCIHQHNSLQ